MSEWHKLLLGLCQMTRLATDSTLSAREKNHMRELADEVEREVTRLEHEPTLKN